MNMQLIKKTDKKYLAYKLNHDEFKCKCNEENCHFTLIAYRLIYAWDKVRSKWGKPLTVNSGFRCQLHNEDIGGENHSRHTIGHAIDIDTHLMEEQEEKDFIELCLAYFDIVLKYDTFIHCHIEPYFYGTETRN